jgi:hypothetical protein
MGKEIKDEYSILLETDNLTHKQHEGRYAELSKKIRKLITTQQANACNKNR